MRRWQAAALAMAALVLAVPASAAAKGRRVVADPFTLATPKARRGQIELLTVSTLPGAVTGGQVLIEVRGLRRGDRLRVTRNGRRLRRSAFRLVAPGVRRGMVTRLRNGLSRISARVRGRGRRRQVATLTVRNHPISGPVISGPQQRPFYCETEKAGLGKPTDRNCSAPTRYDWYYRQASGGSFVKLADPYAPYPSDVATTRTASGRSAPFVVRVESATINRGIARIAVLDDPRARGPGKRFAPALWDRRLTYAFGESCGVGYHQGTNSAATVLGGAPTGADNLFASLYGLAERLARGDVVAASTLTTFGVDCNPLISAETLMMMKEHINEAYGPIERTIGVGGSGGALQQYSAINGFPGLLDGALPIASFTDIPSTAMTVVDCGLLSDYWDRTTLGWSDLQKLAVTGQLSTRICTDWRDLFLPDLDPARGCSGAVPPDVRYDPVKRPRGVRCTLQDANVNIYGRDPATGFARRPYDNVGVQYGLGALLSGAIDAQRFIDLNRAVGGYDIDGNRQAARSAMSAQTARVTYRLGGVVGRGAIARTPVIDMATYLDAVPLLDIHDVVRPFMQRARLRARQGGDRSQAIWRGISTPGDAFGAIETWLDRIGSSGPRTATGVRSAQPAAAADRCIFSGLGTRIDSTGIVGPLGIKVALPLGLPAIPVGGSIPERQEASGFGLCQTLFRARSEPRIVAGGPLRDDVLKCSLKPVSAADYRGRLSAAQVDQMRQIFPTGVCDYSRPGVGETARSMQWVTLGGRRLTKPRSLTWTVARGRTPRR